MACFCGHQEVVGLLLAAGSDSNAPKSDGVTPLHFACLKGYNSLVELLLIGGANPDVLCHSDRPIDVARLKKRAPIVSLLSRPLPEATVAAHQRHIRDCKVKLEEARVNFKKLPAVKEAARRSRLI